MRAYKALPEFRSEAQVRSWIYRIVTNLALNHVTRVRELAHDEVPEPRPAQSTERRVESRLLAEEMDRALLQLSPDLRIPLVMREFEGMSYQEIAAATGLPLNTVRTRILRARRALRPVLEAWR